MVDWDGLENRSRCKPTVGSNPTPSAALSEIVARFRAIARFCSPIGSTLIFQRIMTKRIPPSTQGLLSWCLRFWEPRAKQAAGVAEWQTLRT